MISSLLAGAMLVQTALPVMTLHAPRAALRVEVAKTEPQRERGLMDRTALPRHRGMLFIFDRDAPVAFWMKNTLVPLDMVFVGDDGTVRKIYARVAVVSRALPDDRIPREPGVARYVIELPSGEAARDGIVTGTIIPELQALQTPAPRA